MLSILAHLDRPYAIAGLFGGVGVAFHEKGLDNLELVLVQVDVLDGTRELGFVVTQRSDTEGSFVSGEFW